MLRRFLAAAVMLLFCLGVLIAAEFKGTITKVSTEKGTSITVKGEGDKTETFRVGKKATIVDAKGGTLQATDLKEGNKVTVTFEEKEVKGKTRKVVSEVKVTK